MAKLLISIAVFSSCLLTLLSNTVNLNIFMSSFVVSLKYRHTNSSYHKLRRPKQVRKPLVQTVLSFLWLRFAFCFTLTRRKLLKKSLKNKTIQHKQTAFWNILRTGKVYFNNFEIVSLIVLLWLLLKYKQAKIYLRVKWNCMHISICLQLFMIGVTLHILRH